MNKNNKDDLEEYQPEIEKDYNHATKSTGSDPWVSTKSTGSDPWVSGKQVVGPMSRETVLA